MTDTGTGNSFFGNVAGSNNKGSFNSFFGSGAGFFNDTGHDNAFFGEGAGNHNTDGANNTFIGASAGLSNQSASNSTMIGQRAGMVGNLTNATAIGSSAFVTQSNSLVLGAINGVNGATADTKVGIGTTAPQFQLDVVSNQATADGLAITHFGNDTILVGQSANGTRSAPTATTINDALLDLQGRGFDGTNFVTNRRVSVLMTATQPWTNTANGTKIRFLTTANNTTIPVVRTTIDQDGQVGIGTTLPSKHLHVAGSGDQEIMIESTDIGGIQWSLQSSMGANNGRLEIIDRTANASRMTILNSGNVGVGTTVPDAKLSVNGGADKPGGGSWGTFSDERLKNIKGLFTPGLKAVLQLQPLRYEYKRDNALNLKSEGEHIGFSAQAVQRIIPEAVSKNDKGYLLINNDPILWTMLNAIKEQQAEIAQEQAQIKTQATEIQREEEQIKQHQLVIGSLMKLVCADHPHARMCK